MRFAVTFTLLDIFRVVQVQEAGVWKSLSLGGSMALFVAI